jgi:hypothetical protein
MEGDDVYLRLRDTDFEASPGEVTVKIPIHVWEHIRKSPGITLLYHLMSDQDLLDHVVREVDERIEEVSNASPRSRGLLAFFGSAVYGSAEDPREQQIVHGLEYLSKRREEERDIVKRIQALEAADAR